MKDASRGANQSVAESSSPPELQPTSEPVESADLSEPAQAPEAPDAPPEGYETNIGRRVLLLFGAAVLALLLLGQWAVVVVIAGVLVMITLHELGHFLTAKWAGMKCTEFFLGFGPRLWSFRRGETEYGVKAIPAGAYVRIIGMNNLDEVPAEDEPRSYRQQSFPKRLLVVLAGPATHFIMAWLILFMLLAVTGVPRNSTLIGADGANPQDWEFSHITPGEAADEAGLKAHDKVVAWDGDPVRTFEDLQDKIRSSEVGQDVTLTVQRGDRTFETTAQIKGRPEDVEGGEPGSPFLGVRDGAPEYPADTTVGVFDAVGRATSQTGVVTKEAVVALGRFFSPSGLSSFADNVSEGGGGSSSDSDAGSGGGGTSASEESDDNNRLLSIYGAVRLGAQLGEEGIYGLAIFFLMINIFVGMLNLVPLLPFDGGHAAVAIYERVRSRNGQRYHADVTKLLPLAYAVVFGLIIIGVTAFYLDIVNPVNL